MINAITDARPFTVATSDGRRLDACEAGDADGALVIVHHGTPGAGLIAETWHRDAVARGIRLASVSRPGYAGSSRQRGRRVADAAADTAAVADALGVDRFRTWGISGGGPHALACAALLPDRVIAAASIAGVAPYGVLGDAWLVGMGEDNVEEFGAAFAGEGPLFEYLDAVHAQLKEATPEQLKDMMASLLAPPDLAALESGAAELLYEWTRRGLRNSVDGWLDDDLAFIDDWGFDPAAIDVPTLLAHGEQDLFVPFTHGQWLVRQLPAAEAQLSADDGHLSLLAQIGRTHEWLMEQGR